MMGIGNNEGHTVAIREEASIATFIFVSIAATYLSPKLQSTKHRNGIKIAYIHSKSDSLDSVSNATHESQFFCETRGMQMWQY